MLGRDLEESVANIARFSKKDAQTFRDWNRKAEKITREIFLPERYAEPLPQSRARGAAVAHRARPRIPRGVEPAAARRGARAVRERARAACCSCSRCRCSAPGWSTRCRRPSPMGSVIRAFDLESGYQLCQGGSFNLARGLMETFIAAGGTFQPQVDIDRIVIENGRATGIELADGRTVRARQFVASTLDVHQTFETLIGRAQLPAAFLKKLDAFQYTAWTLFGLHLALQRKPALRRREIRSEHQPRAEMEHRRRDDGGSVLRASGRAGRPRAQARAVRLRALEPARSDAGAAGQAHDLLLARDAARARSRRQELRDLQGRIRRQDHRDALRATART